LGKTEVLLILLNNSNVTGKSGERNKKFVPVGTVMRRPGNHKHPQLGADHTALHFYIVFKDKLR
jgi:hypothetical protein